MYIIDLPDRNTLELADADMRCLTDKFGVVGAEAFIALILREKLDYTKWRRNYFGSMQPGEFHENALAFANAIPMMTKPKSSEFRNAAV